MKRSLLAALVAPALLASCIDYSDGERTGIVAKFSRKGLVCKTWEGELVIGGSFNRPAQAGAAVAATTWKFTVEDESLISKVRAKLESGQQATITYRQEWIASPCRTDSDGDYFATAVR